jgi:TatD DNase family protein
MESNFNESDYLIDSHCHLHYFTMEEIHLLLTNCMESNIRYLLTNSTLYEDFDKSFQIHEKYPYVIAGIGHHPWYLQDIANSTSWLEEIKAYSSKLEEKKIKYFIGEIGIDGGKPKKQVPLDKQIEIFSHQMKLANQLNKLVTIHCVYEWDKLYKTFEALNSNNEIQNLKNGKIILHSFQGTVKHIAKFNNFDVWYSISPGCFNEKNQEMLKSIPLDKLLLESDSPSMFNLAIYDKEDEYNFYLLDPETKKPRNHPMSILKLLEKFAQLRELQISDFKKIIMNNSGKIIKYLL